MCLFSVLLTTSSIRLHFLELGYEEVDVEQVIDATTPEVSGKTANITNRGERATLFP